MAFPYILAIAAVAVIVVWYMFFDGDRAIDNFMHNYDYQQDKYVPPQAVYQG